MSQHRPSVLLIISLLTALFIGLLTAAAAQERPRPPAAHAPASPVDPVAESKRMIELGRYPRAVTLLTAAINRGEHLPHSYKLRGMAYERMGLTARAVKDFTEYITRKPADPKGYILRGDAQNFNLEHEAALKDYTKALELAPKSAEALLGRGLAHAGLEQYDDALKDYRAALLIDPQNAEVLANMGRAYMLAGRNTEAGQSLAKALQLETNAATKKQIREWLDELDPAVKAGEKSPARVDRGGEPQRPERLW